MTNPPADATNAVVLVQVTPDALDRLGVMVEAYYRFDGHHYDREGSRRASDLLDHPEWGRLWFIEYRGQVVGYLILTFSFSLEFLGKDALVDEVFVDASMRGRGVGARAMSLACEQARADGAHAVHLEVRRDNVRAHGAYARVGFEKREAFFLMSRRL